MLHREPDRLLLDDIQDVTRTASILALIGAGVHRVSEIGARLQVPAPSLSRPLARLVDLGWIVRELPFGSAVRGGTRSVYRIAYPFLAFWYRYVEPNRSRLAAGHLELVTRSVASDWPRYLGQRWEAMVRQRIGSGPLLGERWQPASRYWGPSTDRTPIELDGVASHATDPDRVLVAEVKLTATATEARQLLADLERKASTCPPIAQRRIDCCVWVLRLGPVTQSSCRLERGRGSDRQQAPEGATLKELHPLSGRSTDPRVLSAGAVLETG